MKSGYTSDLLFSLVFCILLVGFTGIFALQAQAENHPPTQTMRIIPAPIP